MTSKELDERMTVLYGISQSKLTDKADFKHFTERLIRDCIAEVTPEKYGTSERNFRKNSEFWKGDWNGYNRAIDTIEANTKELLG